VHPTGANRVEERLGQPARFLGRANRVAADAARREEIDELRDRNPFALEIGGDVGGDVDGDADADRELLPLADRELVALECDLSALTRR